MSNAIVVRRTGAFRAESVHEGGGAVYRTQSRVSAHGMAEAYTPIELLCVSAAGCMLGMLEAAAEAHGFSTEGAWVEVSFTKRERPLMLASITFDVWIEGASPNDRERRILQAAARSCPVFLSLHESVEKVVNFHF